MLRRLLTVTLATLLISGCVAINDRTSVQVGYYDVRGTSFEELDQNIALHGPVVEGVGKAIASTSVRMVPDISYGMRGGQCEVVRARIRVQANVTLPKLRDINRAKQEMRGAFSNIERYARLHEAVHVAIADEHAEAAEKAIAELPPRPNCDRLRNDIVQVIDKMQVAHNRAQLRFDEEEKIRFRDLANS